MKVSVAGASLHVDVEVGGWCVASEQVRSWWGKALDRNICWPFNDHLNDYLWQRLTSSQDGVHSGGDAFQTKDTQDGGLTWTTWKSWTSFHKCSVYLLAIGHTLSDFFPPELLRSRISAYVIGITRQPGLFYFILFFSLTAKHWTLSSGRQAPRSNQQGQSGLFNFSWQGYRLKPRPQPVFSGCRETRTKTGLLDESSNLISDPAKNLESCSGDISIAGVS